MPLKKKKKLNHTKQKSMSGSAQAFKNYKQIIHHLID